MALKKTTDYEELQKTYERRGVTPAVLLHLMKIAGRWVGQQRRLGAQVVTVEKVEKALRSLIADLDYDMHKYLERDEETCEDHYPSIAQSFFEEITADD